MQNVLLFMTPKSQVAFLQEDYTIRQALEKMKFHRYSSVPIIDKDGKYIGSVTEGDIFWYIYNSDLNFNSYDLEDVKLSEVPRNRTTQAVKASQEITELFDMIINQNFVPVVDDSNRFIGIITRKSVIEYLIKTTNEKIDE